MENYNEDSDFLKKRIYNVCIDALTDQDKELLKQAPVYELIINPPSLNLFGWKAYKGINQIIFQVPFGNTGKYGYRKFVSKHMVIEACVRVFADEIGDINISMEDYE